MALVQITVTSMFTNHTRNKQTSKRSSSVQPPQEPNQPRILTEKSSSTLHHNKSSRQATGAKGTEGHCRSEYQHQHQSQNKLRLPDGPGVQTQQAAYERNKWSGCTLLNQSVLPRGVTRLRPEGCRPASSQSRASAPPVRHRRPSSKGRGLCTSSRARDSHTHSRAQSSSRAHSRA